MPIFSQQVRLESRRLDYYGEIYTKIRTSSGLLNSVLELSELTILMRSSSYTIRYARLSKKTTNLSP
ncbi:hypothetical protein KIN20_019166 [Parelaphostrongylus tenuis]|uniref:Uncharacterized protein n=1 Tax=Parelaphostrongylus tenuis TaxID=148309 RepID=A0AAD5N4I4_PARTN|nr:hypothetical protein KIN20_019166 [Parelaphostrongylus tenuis]